MNDNIPSLLFADSNGNIMDFEPLAMAARNGDYLLPPEDDDLIELPAGSELYVLPDRHPIGFDRETGEMVVLTHNPYDPSKEAFAVAVFLPAAHTQLSMAAWEKDDCACVLPLYAYTAAGYRDGFVTTAFRTDSSSRQDPETFNMDRVRSGIKEWEKLFGGNRLIKHLSHCALTYGCPAALNMFQSREEAPLPTSRSCNARCLGCISHQPAGGPPSPQNRIDFTPSPEEVAEVAIKHLTEVDGAVVSFGQGCEGEPLLAGDVLEKSIILMRKKTTRGTINLNSNASLPGTVARLADAGLDSLRISMNSTRETTYNKYFRPVGFTFADVVESAHVMKERNLFVSLNLFVFPGVTDAPAEAESLKRFVKENAIDMIQWRNLNIDPDYYMDNLAIDFPVGIGMRRLIEEVPVRRGYFNPSLKND